MADFNGRHLAPVAGLRVLPLPELLLRVPPMNPESGIFQSKSAGFFGVVNGLYVEVGKMGSAR